MRILPHTLSIITTHQCTAACDNCCFSCTPKVTKAIPIARIMSLIDEAMIMESIRVVVFTGGECFLLGDDLDHAVAKASDCGFITRCVTNGYWGTSARAAAARIASLKKAGLDEINFSTGEFHSKYVPISRVAMAAVASANAGLRVLVNVETCNEANGAMSELTGCHGVQELVDEGRILLQSSVWIENAQGDGVARPTHESELGRFVPENMTGCQTVLNVLAVTPDQDLVTCCGLHLEAIPELHIGSVGQRSIESVVSAAPYDFMKIWLHVEGPEKILAFVREKVPGYPLPIEAVHPCTTCLYLYSDPIARAAIVHGYEEKRDEVVQAWLTELAIQELDKATNGERSARRRRGSAKARRHLPLIQSSS